MPVVRRDLDGQYKTLKLRQETLNAVIVLAPILTKLSPKLSGLPGLFGLLPIRIFLVTDCFSLTGIGVVVDLL